MSWASEARTKVRAVLDGSMDAGAIASYSVNGRSLSTYSLTELMDYLKYLDGIVAFEDRDCDFGLADLSGGAPHQRFP